LVERPAKDLSMAEFNRQLDQPVRQMENRTDSLGILESQLFDAKVRRSSLPTIPPVDAAYLASSFGWRIDPSTACSRCTEGLDFPVDIGTPIFAARAAWSSTPDPSPPMGTSSR